MMETSTKTISMVTESMCGQTEESTMDNGLTTKWKVKVLSPGVMAEDMLDNTRTTKNTDKEHSSGQTAENISENGTKENNTEQVCT